MLLTLNVAAVAPGVNNKSHDNYCNRNSATEVGNVRVESFHAASASRMSLLFFLWPMATA